MLHGINLKEKYKIFSTPKTDVEHRTAHQADHAVLNVFETRQVTQNFDLSFDSPVVVSMIQGKKTMHLRSKDPFPFLPGQTIVMPASELMYIDFPEATQESPTQCMALEISGGFVKSTLNWLNDFFPKVDAGSWSWSTDSYHLLNNEDVQYNLNRLIRIMVESDFSRQLKASNTTRELIANLMQTQARAYLLENLNQLSTRNRLAHVIQYIRRNLHTPLTVALLARQAYLSKPQFFRAFQRELGETPIQFINRERLQLAKRKISQQGLSFSSASLESGFASLNYFSRVFRQLEGMSPSEWKIKHTQTLPH